MLYGVRPQQALRAGFRARGPGVALGLPRPGPGTRLRAMAQLEGYYFSAALSCTFLVSCLLFSAFSRALREPYMDEIFHLPQAQRYCEGRFSLSQVGPCCPGTDSSQPGALTSPSSALPNSKRERNSVTAAPSSEIYGAICWVNA